MEAIRKEVELEISQKMKDCFAEQKMKILFTNQMDVSPFLDDKEAVYYTEVSYKRNEKAKDVRFGFFHNNTEKGFARNWNATVAKRWLYVGLDEYPNIMKQQLGMSSPKQYYTMLNCLCDVADRLNELAYGKKRKKENTKKYMLDKKLENGIGSER